MPIKFKTTTRNTARFGISGAAGTGKSTAITRVSQKPLVYDLERKWTQALKPVEPVEFGEVNFTNLKQSLMAILRESSIRPYDFVWIDSASELGRLCEDHAIEVDYKGKKNNYSSYSAGPKHELIQYFTEILRILGSIEEKHGVNVGIICHVDEGTKSNAMGSDYDKIMLDVNKNLRPPLLKWFDWLGCVYDDIDIGEDGMRKKVGETSKRMISFDNACPLYDAKRSSLSGDAILNFDINGNWYRTLFNTQKKEQK